MAALGIVQDDAKITAREGFAGPYRAAIGRLDAALTAAAEASEEVHQIHAAAVDQFGVMAERSPRGYSHPSAAGLIRANWSELPVAGGTRIAFGRRVAWPDEQPPRRPGRRRRDLERDADAYARRVLGLPVLRTRRPLPPVSRQADPAAVAALERTERDLVESVSLMRQTAEAIVGIRELERARRVRPTPLRGRSLQHPTPRLYRGLEIR